MMMTLAKTVLVIVAVVAIVIVVARNRLRAADGEGPAGQRRSAAVG